MSWNSGSWNSGHVQVKRELSMDTLVTQLNVWFTIIRASMDLCDRRSLKRQTGRIPDCHGELLQHAKFCPWEVLGQFQQQPSFFDCAAAFPLEKHCRWRGLVQYLLSDTAMELGRLVVWGVIFLCFIAWLWRIPRFYFKIGRSIQYARMDVSNPSNLSTVEILDCCDRVPLLGVVCWY